MTATRPSRNGDPTPPACFNEVYARELRALRPDAFTDIEAALLGQAARAAHLSAVFRRVGEDLDATGRAWDPKHAPLAALCLSGGGIRSATFNLGMLQGLARAGLLEQFDYLSSVSGGGFVAGWLKAWMHRDGTEKVIEQLRGTTAKNCGDPLHPEPKPIDQLRHYSNYLTPRVGIFSPDTWTVAALVLRNLLLNWLIIIPLLAALLSVPQMAFVTARELGNLPRDLVGVTSSLLLLVAIALGFVASYNVHRYRRVSLEPPRQGLGAGTPGVPERKIAVFAVLPMFLAAGILAGAALARPWEPWCCLPQSGARAVVLLAAIWGVVIPVLGWLPHRPSQRWERELFALVVSGLIGAAVLTILAKWGYDYLSKNLPLYVVVAVPLLLADYLLARALFIGLAGEHGVTFPFRRRRPETWTGAEQARATLDRADHDREWWARFSGWVMAIGIGWGIASVIAILAFGILGQMANKYLPAILASVGGISGIIVAILGKSGDTPSGRSKWGPPSVVKQRVLLLAAPTFVVLLLVTIAQGNIALMDTIAARWTDTALERVLILPTLALLLVGFGSLIGLAVNVNRFSLHGLYRNRLVRAYLGASNKARKEDPFTGFAHGDNLFLRDLWRPGDATTGRPGCTRPLAVINASLNLVTGEKLAWQHRKAESFSMTPFYCGNFHEGYRRTSEYGGEFGISLGTAMTISGAAANPNMGYHSSAAVTFLMALFNARLGSWLGNTNEHGASTYTRAGPKWAVKPLFSELFGMTTATSPYVNLSDGGHFDNLGLYEMVLRRCRFILVSDAGRDPKHAFEDLGNAIRKVRIDFGIPIEFERRIQIPPRSASAVGLFCAVARVGYSTIDGSSEDADGWLVYVKPALNARGARRRTDAPVPYDVFSYAQHAQDFPHETTTDQWFDEPQFESYRALGLHIMTQLTAAMRGDLTPTLPEFRESVLDYVSDVTTSVAAFSTMALLPEAERRRVLGSSDE